MSFVRLRSLRLMASSRQVFPRTYLFEYDCVRENIIVCRMIDRDTEREWFRSHLADGQQLLVIYGRRRVGKTRLVTDVLDRVEMPSVYYLARSEPLLVSLLLHQRQQTLVCSPQTTN
jgi:Cdc6-like AAA superfamily ATPase